MSLIHWDSYRNADGSFDLIAIYDDVESLTDGDPSPPAERKLAHDFLNDVEALYPIRSRQVAALCITAARHKVGMLLAVGDVLKKEKG